MSGNPTTLPAPTNVVPMPTNWPGPMFNPGARPWPQSPSCFSELAGLNACYDSVQMMEQILAKVVCDLATNNAAFAQCLVEAIAKSGSNVPLIGVTNGADAQPGQVGEYVSFASATINIPTAANSQTVTLGTLQPGDWDMWLTTTQLSQVHDMGLYLASQPGFAVPIASIFMGSGGEIIQLVTSTSRGLVSVPTLIAVNVITNQAGAGSAASTTEVTFMARRRR